MSDRMRTTSTTSIIKSMLIGFNMAFWASGLIMLSSGIWFQIGLHRYMELSTYYTNSFQILLVTVGIIIIFIASIACCCTLKAESSILYLYSGFLILIFIIETIIAGSLFTYKDSFSEGLKGGLNKSIRNYGPETVMKSADFDAMQEHLGCCGNIDYRDWYGLVPPRLVPRSCCRNGGPVRCDTQDERQIYNQGCYKIVTEYLDKHMGRIAASVFGVSIFPLTGAILSIILAKNINKAKYEQMA